MRPALWSSILRALALVALLTSAALTVDYLSTDPAFCGAGSGCGDVRRSGFGYLGSVPLPALGLAGYALVLGLSLAPGFAFSVACGLALGGGIAALGLLGLQAFVVGRFCALCVVVDLAALGAAAAAAALLFGSDRNTDPKAALGPLRAWAWAALGALAVAAPAAWPAFRPAPDVPEGVRRHYVSGKINVVEFVDFQCPFCRMLHPTLKAVAAEYGDRVNFVRLDLPLASHALARGAARAHVCGQAQGKGEEIADALFEAEDLSPEALSSLARELGLELQKFESCLASPETEAQIARSERILRDAELLQGLPTTFVGGQMLVGAQDAAALRDAFESARRGDAEHGVPGPIYLLVVVVGAGLIVGFGRRAPDAESPAREPAAG